MQIASFMLNYIPLKRPLFVGWGGGGEGGYLYVPSFTCRGRGYVAGLSLSLLQLQSIFMSYSQHEATLHNL